MFGVKLNLRERECITISSDSEVEDEDTEVTSKENVPSLKSSRIMSLKLKNCLPDKEIKRLQLKCIDDLVEELLMRNQQSTKTKNYRKNHCKGTESFDSDAEEVSQAVVPSSSLLRDDNKCAKLGLRKTIKSVKHYQAEVSSSKHKRRKSSNSTSHSDDNDSNSNDAIMYLLSKSPKTEVDKTANQVKRQSLSETCRRDPVLSPDEWLKKVKSFSSLFSGEICLKDLCLSCGSTSDLVCPHPLFEGSLCQDHKNMIQEWFFKYDQDGCSSYCAICCMGVKVVVCDQPGCGRCYCSNCLELLVGPGHFKAVTSTDNWKCYLCADIPPTDQGFIIKRPDWQEKLVELFSHESSGNYRYAFCASKNDKNRSLEFFTLDPRDVAIGSNSWPLNSFSQFEHPKTIRDKTRDAPAFPVPLPLPFEKRRPIRVLSLFDGIGTGLLALKQLGLKIGQFVASEIDEDAIRLVQNRHPEVIHVGDITKLSDNDVNKYGPFDLVMGGSPCNDLSGANPRRKGLIDHEGTGCLFFDFYRVLNIAKPRPFQCKCQEESDERPFFWLFENVVSMKRVERQRISRFLGCDPVLANANAVSAAARPRFFWGNLPHMQQFNLVASPQDKLDVQSCLEPGRTANVKKLNTITTKPGCLYQGNDRQAPVTHQGKMDVLWTTEVERVFGVPEHYTDVNNLGPKERLALLGRSWSVPVVRHLLAPLKEYFC